MPTRKKIYVEKLQKIYNFSPERVKRTMCFTNFFIEIDYKRDAWSTSPDNIGIRKGLFDNEESLAESETLKDQFMRVDNIGRFAKISWKKYYIRNQSRWPQGEVRGKENTRIRNLMFEFSGDNARDIYKHIHRSSFITPFSMWSVFEDNAETSSLYHLSKLIDKFEIYFPETGEKIDILKKVKDQDSSFQQKIRLLRYKLRRSKKNIHP